MLHNYLAGQSMQKFSLTFHLRKFQLTFFSQSQSISFADSISRSSDQGPNSTTFCNVQAWANQSPIHISRMPKRNQPWQLWLEETCTQRIQQHFVIVMTSFSFVGIPWAWVLMKYLLQFDDFFCLLYSGSFCLKGCVNRVDK